MVMDYLCLVLALCQVFEGLPKEFAEDQDTVVRYMKLLPPVFSDEDRRAEAAMVSHRRIFGAVKGLHRPSEE